MALNTEMIVSNPFLGFKIKTILNYKVYLGNKQD